MKRLLILILFSGILFSCVKKDEAKSEAKKETSEKKDFQMYEMSEMSILMEKMYVDNMRLKDRIKNGDTIGQFPQDFLRIHEAVMTDDKENDAFFKEQAVKFIKAQELIYNDPKNAKEHFNNGVDACLSCHEVKCGGPIPRIKKLYLE